MSDHRNRLADETSPYLRQHADNPVDWYPWGDEALETARRDEKPIFLSVGYSACHWCHVMERESFEDDEVAELLNDFFVNVKVDREERPDLDSIYMDAVQMLTGQGGWPMSVWLTPQLEPFYAGTYFPPESRWGRPGFVDVVEEVHRVWTEERDRISGIAEAMTERLENLAEPDGGADSLGGEPVRGAADALSRKFDPKNGGFGRKPKFPPASQCRLLLRVATDGDFSDQERDRARHMVDETLVRMASGGMYDHLGGGFHRYSTDEKWLIPHFEKMLYDNALLMTTYREGFEVLGRPFFRRIVEETAGYVLREMHDDEETGAFFSTQDADTEGEEGKFFVWTPQQMKEVLDDERGRRAADYWGVSEEGNFEDGKSALHRLDAVDFDEEEVPGAELDEEFEQMRRELFEARQSRTRPARDDKIIASWNGLMIEALASAGATFGCHDWIDAAVDAANFVLDEMCDGDRAHGLHRIHHSGRTRFDGCLDDYANMVLATTALYEATGEPEWLDDAERLVDDMNRRFQRDEGGYYYSVAGRDDLIVRQTNIHDRAIPSASSRALEALHRVNAWLDIPQLEDRMEEGLRAHYGPMVKQSAATTNMIRVLDSHLSGPLEIVCIRAGDDEQRIDEAVRRTYLRHGVGVVVDESEIAEEQPPVVHGKKSVDGRTAVYVCQRGECAAPVVAKEEFREQIEAVFSTD